VTTETTDTVVYDSREATAYIKVLRHNLPDHRFVRETLPVGDYVVNGTVIERKSVEDLLHSIQDGRLNNQLWEMSRNTEVSVLAIVGDLWREVAHDPVLLSIVSSVLAGVWFRRAEEGAQGIVVPLQFPNDATFATFIRALSRKGRVRRPHLTRVRVTGNDRLVGTVASVPGWGERLARSALEHYGSILTMVLTRPQALAHNVRGCGMKKAQAFHEHFRRRYESERRDKERG